jgi:hypothetical protein
MSLIQYFENLHVTIKSTIITVLGQMPFFFVAIYLFKHSLIDLISEYPFSDIDFLFVASICFCLSITWFAMNVILTLIVFKFGDYIYKDETEIDNVFKLSMWYSIGYLSIAIFINFKLKFDFFWFLVFAYGFIVFRLIYVGIVWYVYSKKQKKKINTHPHQ